MDTRTNEILGYVPESLKSVLKRTFEITQDTLQEIRIRSGLPLIVNTSNGSFAVLKNGEVSPAVGGAYIVDSSEVKQIFRAICENSVYAYSEDIKQGFVTIRGGHRVGITGRAITNGEKMEGFREISSLNIRVAREVIGAADEIVNQVLTPSGIKDTLIVAPPSGGKTTVLRDLARQISNSGIKTAIVDDRGELASIYKSIPQNNIGLQSDVIENAVKAEAVVMLLRTMSPQVIITDEISTEFDAMSIAQCFGTGVSVVATTHGKSAEEVKNRSIFKNLVGSSGFKQIIVLHKEGYGLNTKIQGTITEVC